MAEASPADFFGTLAREIPRHPYATSAAILFIALCIGLSFLKPVELVKIWLESRKNDKVEAAEQTIDDLTENLTWLRSSLDVARDTVERVNRIRLAGDRNAALGGLVHVADWTQRLFGFLQADINKVTVWAPTGRTLKVIAWNGMRPESAEAVVLQLDVPAGEKAPFAVLAYHSKKAQICSDRDTDPRYVPLSQRSSHAYKAIIAVPLIVGAECVGVLTVDSLHVGAFDGEDARQLAQLCASLMALYFSPVSGTGSDSLNP
jgi:putative methionine-R-sulfoxide reductase with GAF domain